MIVKIDILSDSLDVGSDDEDTLVALENLASMSRESRCYLIAGDRSVFEVLSKNLHISAVARGEYKRLESKLTQWFEMGQLAPWLICIPYVRGDLSRVRDEKEVMFMPLVWFKNHKNAGSPFLLTENRTDSKLIIRLAENIKCDWLPLPRKISIESEHGGGDTTADVLRDLVKQGDRLGICLVDSDRFRPGGAQGGTALKVSRFLDQSVLVDVVVLEERELENSFRWKLIRDVCAEDAEEDDILFFDKMSETGHYYYADIKSGLCKRSLFKRTEDDRSFWSPYFKEGQCMDRCQSADRGCACFLVPSVAGRLLGKLLDYPVEQYQSWSLNDVSPSLRRAVTIVWCLGASPPGRSM